MTEQYDVLHDQHFKWLTKSRYHCCFEPVSSLLLALAAFFEIFAECFRKTLKLTLNCTELHPFYSHNLSDTSIPNTILKP